MLIHQSGVWIKNKWIPPLSSGVRHRFCTLIKHYIPNKIPLTWVKNDCLIWRRGQENGKAWVDKHMPLIDAERRVILLTHCHSCDAHKWQAVWKLSDGPDRGHEYCSFLKIRLLFRYCMHASVAMQAPKFAQPFIHRNSSPLEFL